MGQGGCVCIFAKPPRPGKVKTRLAARIGNEDAAILARAFLHDTLAAVNSLGFAKVVIASTEPMPSALDSGVCEIWLQGEGDLGARLERILRRAVRAGSFAIAVGADTPGLPGRFLEQARAALRTADAVLGPCEDGGFYLLGVRRCPEGLLAGIPWSDRDTCEQTRVKLKAAGLSIHLLTPWFDVDRPADLTRLQAMIAAGDLSAPRTQEALAGLGSGWLVNRGRKISVVIPVLNERAWLPQTLGELRRQKWMREVIVVDGGSRDGTLEWLAGQEQIRVVQAPRGRGPQLNAGAKLATGDTLLFLHADCVLPSGSGGFVQAALAPSDVVGGCFRITFDRKNPLSLRLVAAGINLRTCLTRSGTGDQAIFVKRDVFERVGGFRDWPLFEDVDLVSRMKRAGRFVIVSSSVTVSARRHLQRGVFRTVMLVYALRLGYCVGISPFRLARWFQDARSSTLAPARCESEETQCGPSGSGAEVSQMRSRG